MRKLVCIGLASAVLSAIAALGAYAQPAADVRPPPSLNVITNFARVDKANVGGGDCSANGILQSDRGALNTSTYLVECVHRTASGSYPPEVHPGQDQVYYIMKGEATLIYGGKVVARKLSAERPSISLLAMSRSCRQINRTGGGYRTRSAFCSSGANPDGEVACNGDWLPAHASPLQRSVGHSEDHTQSFRTS